MGVSRRDFIAGSVALGATATAARAGAVPEASSGGVERWGVFETALDGPKQGNPFDDITLAGVFESGGKRVRVPGFYDGDGIYRIRFSPAELGHWTWKTESNAATLNGHSGAFECVRPGPDNHGPVSVTPDGYHFAYADGTPFRQIGTTAYSWAQQSDARCDQTLATLRASPFNKMRMLVFPNVPSVATNPFVRTGPGLHDWDPTRLDPAYFRRYEDRIRRLGEIGVEADVILFHPYDPKRGYSDMKRADDERYLRYVAARFGAFRNVWWSLGNEYDEIKTKTIADWDHLFQVVEAADPHNHLRSIHQIIRYYDARKPWVTHASVQNNAAVTGDIPAQLHRSFAEKAVIFDEVAYEGDIEARWGCLKPEELVERFWWGTIGGTYVGHSETYSPDRNADYSWLGQGGKLVGTSPPRLAFLRRIMEEGPTPGIEPIQTWWSYHLGGKPHEYYLRYFGSDRPSEWAVKLPGRSGDPLKSYRADIIDTWNMTITPVDGVFKMAVRDKYNFQDPDRPTIALPGKPYVAVRLIAV
jgi:hypothetical protein